jgi:hypothetical protein
MLVFTLPLYAGTQIERGFEYTIENNAITVTGWKGKAVDVAIPDVLDSLPVKVIAPSAFENKNIRSITLPESLTHIGLGAFADNRITELTLPKSLMEIGAGAFSGNHVNTVKVS